MDLKVIEDTIQLLENEATSVENVQDLANLYTVYDKLKYKQPVKSSSHAEFNDILPAFEKYLETKKHYQLGEGQEESVQHALKLLCQELKEFIETLYSSTSSRKERLSIQYLVRDLNKKFNK